MQRQDNFLQKSYNQSQEGVPVSQQEERYRGTPKQYASEGVPVSQQEERYRGTPEQFASEPSSTTSTVQPVSQVNIIVHFFSMFQNKVGKMQANKHICHASAIYREILANTDKYDLPPWNFYARHLDFNFNNRGCLTLYSILLVY